MRARVSKQGRTKRVPARKVKRLRNSVVGRVEYLQDIVLEESPRAAVSIYAEETETRDHKEEPAA